MGCVYMDKSLLDAVRCIDQQILCYLTACENEQHHLDVVEKAIVDDLIPKLEELLAEDGMHGGEHPMARKTYQGQTGLFYNGNAYLVNYQFARGKLCEGYRKAGILPAECAKSVQYDGEKLLDMIQELYSDDLNFENFAGKYKRNIPLREKDKLMQGLGYSLRLVAEHGCPQSELVDVMAYQNGVTFWVTADKKAMDNTMFIFIGRNQQALGMGRPRLENGTLIAGSEVIRYDVVYSFMLTDPHRSKERMRLNVMVDLVHRVLDNGSRHVQSFSVDFTEEESAQIASLMKKRFFSVELPVKPHRVPATIGEEFEDNYYLKYGTTEQKEAVNQKWASTDAGYRRILDLSRLNKEK